MDLRKRAKSVVSLVVAGGAAALGASDKKYVANKLMNQEEGITLKWAARSI